MESSPLLIVLSGPSGVGKDAVLSGMQARGLSLHWVVTATTRSQRLGEEGGVNYHFLSEGRFQEMREKGELLEWAQVYDYWYGVPRKALEQALEREQDALVKVDVQGATTLKGMVPEAVFIFLIPPSREELISRLRQRHTESPRQLALRLEKVKEEMSSLLLFDYVVVNDEVEKAIDRILAIITAEKCRTHRRHIQL